MTVEGRLRRSCRALAGHRASFAVTANLSCKHQLRIGFRSVAGPMRSTWKSRGIADEEAEHWRTQDGRSTHSRCVVRGDPRLRRDAVHTPHQRAGGLIAPFHDRPIDIRVQALGTMPDFGVDDFVDQFDH